MNPAAESKVDVAALRREYTLQGLRRQDLAASPFVQFGRWFQEALATQSGEANAMTLATASTDGQPSARIVLLKAWDERGFVYFGNYTSRKAQDLEANPRAALLFFWDALERQVRIEGAVEKITREESEAYFLSRPLGSRLGAWASHQSAVVSSREELEAQMRHAEEKFPDGHVPLPPFWGGYRIQPQRIEFWQGRQARLHDRLCYSLEADGTWEIERLAP
ncbi:MAG: pyridoxamine 5'-phosphate oxidase [Chthoniobacteraceae bacterium]